MKSLVPLTCFMIVTVSFLTLFLNAGCSKENMGDDRPDFIFQGTLTEVSDGTPKVGWTVYLREFISLYDPRPPGWFAPTTFGFDSISLDGRFSMEVNAFTNFEIQGDGSGENSPEARQAYYTRHVLSFRAPGDSHGFLTNNPSHLFLDPDDVDLNLDEHDFSRRGEVITRDVKVFTGDRGWVTYQYLIERMRNNGEVFRVETSFRDLAFDKPYLTISPTTFSGIEADVQYERKGICPVGRPVEATTSFETITAGNNQTIVVLASQIIRDTFLLQSAADTLQLRNYTY